VRAVRAEIGFRGPEHRRRAWTFGSPFDVWEVVQAWQDLQQDVGKAQAQLELTHNVKDFPEILRDWRTRAASTLAASSWSVSIWASSAR